MIIMIMITMIIMIPILVTLVGITTDVNSVHGPKALLAIAVYW